MTPVDGTSPDLMPVLARGKHRTPRSGGCFMEFASYLAGESWSDHPACTHPVLASLARMVNDCTSDTARSKLSPLIPGVIGLIGDDRRVAPVVALRAATAALPVASAERQRALSVGILTCERRLAALDESASRQASAQARDAFAQAPDAERWAHDFIYSVRSWSRTKFTTHTADSILRVSVQGIAEACINDPDERLHALLTQAIADCDAILRTSADARVAPVPARL